MNGALRANAGQRGACPGFPTGAGLPRVSGRGPSARAVVISRDLFLLAVNSTGSVVKEKSLFVNSVQEHRDVIGAQARNDEKEERAKAVGAWWARISGEFAPVEPARRIASFDVDLDALLEHLEGVMERKACEGDPVRTLHWFTRPEGISRLWRLQSESHSRRGGQPVKRGMAERLGDLL